jgi:hypothetical protein
LRSWPETCQGDFAELTALASHNLGKDGGPEVFDLANPAEIEDQPRTSTFHETLHGVLDLTGGTAVKGTIQQNQHFPTLFLKCYLHGCCSPLWNISQFEKATELRKIVWDFLVQLEAI